MYMNKGKLAITKDGWVVEYNLNEHPLSTKQELPLHPDQAKYMHLTGKKATGLPKFHSQVIYFEIVSLEFSSECGNHKTPKTFAKLINPNKEFMELTGVDFLIHNIVQDQNVKAKPMSEWLKIFEQAKAMDKKQKSDEYWKGWKAYGESL